MGTNEITMKNINNPFSSGHSEPVETSLKKNMQHISEDSLNFKNGVGADSYAVAIETWLIVDGLRQIFEKSL